MPVVLPSNKPLTMRNSSASARAVEMLPEDTKQSYQELLQVLKDAGMDTSGLEGADDLSGLSSGLKAMVGIIGMMTDDMDPNDPLLPVLQQGGRQRGRSRRECGPAHQLGAGV